MIKKKLYIFSECYPYGNGEVFLHNEVIALSKYFEEIYILPRKKKKGQRALPPQAKVIDVLTKKGIIDKILTTLTCFFYIRHWNEFISGYKRYNSNFFKSLVTFFGYCIDGYYYLNKIKELNIADSILFSYWFKHAAFAIALTNDHSNLKIIRSHRGDLYEDIYMLPFRKFIAQRIDKIYCISRDGADYLQSRYGILKDKIDVNRLGTYRHFPVSEDKQSSDIIKVVTCSMLIKRKRVFEILTSLKHFASHHPKQEIHYIHFGTGSELTRITNEILTLPANLKVDLRGETLNKDIHLFYSKEKPNLFINFSSSEGIPISIMEAMSYGIAIIATDVGGTSEAVSEKAGILISPSSSIIELADQVERITISNKASYLPENIKDVWQSNFSADQNYYSFVNSIKELFVDQVITHQHS